MHTEKQSAPAIHTVTPQLAQRWLVFNNDNRAARPAQVEHLAAEMRAGRFHLSSDAIAFDTAGNLINGQHRLKAIVSSGCTVPLLVVRDLAPASRLVLDTGARRKVADTLHYTEKVPHAHLLVPMCSVLHRMATRSKRATAADVLSVHARYARAINWVITQAGPSRMFFTTGPVLAALTLGRAAMPAETARFWELLTTGAEIPAVAVPLIALRAQGMKGAFAHQHHSVAFYATCNALAEFAGGKFRSKLYADEKGYAFLTATPAAAVERSA